MHAEANRKKRKLEREKRLLERAQPGMYAYADDCLPH